MSYTDSHFLTEKMGGFYHNSTESNQTIANRVSEWFMERDNGYYAAVVWNKDDYYPVCVASFSGKKLRTVRVHNKQIKVWKQRSSTSTRRMNTYFGAFVDGLIGKYPYDVNRVRDALDTELDGSYAVVKYEKAGMKCYYHDHCYTTCKNGKKWSVWRQM